MANLPVLIFLTSSYSEISLIQLGGNDYICRMKLPKEFIGYSPYVHKIFCSTDKPIKTINPKWQLKYWIWGTWHRRDQYHKESPEHRIIDYQTLFSLN